MKIYRKKSRYSNRDATLPSNYGELFFDTIKQNWQRIILIGIFSFFFFLPVLVFMFMKDYYFLSLASKEYTEAEIDALKITSRNLLNIGVALGIVFASIGVSGLSRINLLTSREEGCFFFKDFNKGVKQNLKSNIIFFLIYGILIYLSLLVMNNVNAKYLIYIPFGVVQTLFFPLVLINIETTSIYDCSLKDAFRNSTFIYIKNFIFVFLFSLGLTSILLLELVSYIFLKYILYALSIVIIYPFIILGMRVYFNKILDRDINKEHYPEIYKMGIYERK